MWWKYPTFNVFTLIMVVQNYVGIFRECSDRDGKLRLRLVLLLSSFIDGGQGQLASLMSCCRPVLLESSIFFVNFAVIKVKWRKRLYAQGQQDDKLAMPLKVKIFFPSYSHGEFLFKQYPFPSFSNIFNYNQIEQSLHVASLQTYLSPHFL